MSLFYRISQEEFIRSAAWDEIDGAVEQLVALQRKRGPLGMFKRTFRSSSTLGDAQLRLIEFESRQVAVGGHITREVSKLYREPGLRLAKELVQAEHAERFEYPSQEIGGATSPI